MKAKSAVAPLCVGWRAFVHWPQPPGAPPKPVPLLDDTGRALASDLADGQEVEILAWRPRSREGTSYRVRRISDNGEWWIAASFLRRAAVSPPPPPAG
jgi:hypothetical protein